MLPNFSKLILASILLLFSSHSFACDETIAVQGDLEWQLITPPCNMLISVDAQFTDLFGPRGSGWEVYAFNSILGEYTKTNFFGQAEGIWFTQSGPATTVRFQGVEVTAPVQKLIFGTRVWSMLGNPFLEPLSIPGDMSWRLDGAFETLVNPDIRLVVYRDEAYEQLSSPAQIEVGEGFFTGTVAEFDTATVNMGRIGPPPPPF